MWMYVVSIIVIPVVVLIGYVALRIILAVLCYNTKKHCYKANLTRMLPQTIPLFKIMEPNGLRCLIPLTVGNDGTLKEQAFSLGPHLNGTPTCWFADSNYFRELLNDSVFPKLDIAYEPFKRIIGDGLVTSTGDLWKRQRKLLTPLFRFSMLKQMPIVMEERIEELCEHLREMNGKSVKATTLFGVMTIQIVVDCIFGGKRYIDADTMHELWEAAVLPLNDYFVTSMLLGESINKVMPLPPNLKIKSNMKKLLEYVNEAIVKKKKDLETLGSENDSDLLASLLRVKDGTTGESIPDHLIVDESLTFLFAGHDTTSALLSWCCSLLVFAPEVIKKMRQEIEDVMGDRRKISFDDVRQFRYCENVLKETLRMRGPVPFLSRAIISDTKLGDTLLKKGTYVYIGFISSHFDNRFWKDPMEFRPERFDTENKSEPAVGPYSYAPFSAGPRNCIGQKFAMMEGVMAIVHVIREFDIVTEQKEEDIIWAFEGTMKPINFHCSFVPREN